jgi:hypothetical protein
MTLGCVRAICKLVVTCYKLKHLARNLAEMINNGMKNLEREREREGCFGLQFLWVFFY